MNVHKITLEEWEYRREQNPMSVATSTAFIKSYTESYEVEYSIYSVEKDFQVLLAIIIFHKGRDAKSFTHFFNTPFYKKVDLSDDLMNEAFESLLITLKKDFNAIDLKLSARNVNTSVFKSWDFHPKRYQTYVIDLAKELKYSLNIRRMLKKATLEGFYVRLIENNSDIIQLQINDMLDKGIPTKHAEPIRRWIQTLNEIGAIKAFVLYDADRKMQGSCLIVDDKELSAAYLLSIFSRSGIGQSPLYDAFIQHFKSKNYSVIDLWGGNIPSIAQFKAKWDSDVEYYYVLSYRKYPYIARSIVSIKGIIKNLLKRV